MTRLLTMLTTTAALLAACRAKPEADAMAGMATHDSARADSAPAERTPVHLSAAQARAVGVTFAVVERGPLARTVRTVGQVVPAEPGLADITSKLDGFVEQLYVAATGATVRRGQPLLTLYSPMLVAAQEELLAAKRLDSTAHSVDTESLLEASRRRLSYWDISRAQIEHIESTGEVTKTLTLNAPANGVVLEKMVVAGQAVTSGMKLFRIADLSTVWIEGAVFEQDLAFIRAGAPAQAELAAYPGRFVHGRVSFVWPTVDEQSRTVRVRVAFANPGGLLKPGMYATLLFEALVPGGDVLQVPAEAVVQTGVRNLVFVVAADGALTPREIVLGPRAGGRFQVLSGLAAGERIVASANFLVDAESRLATGAGTAMPGMDMAPEKKRP